MWIMRPQIESCVCGTFGGNVSIENGTTSEIRGDNADHPGGAVQTHLLGLALSLVFCAHERSAAQLKRGSHALERVLRESPPPHAIRRLSTPPPITGKSQRSA